MRASVIHRFAKNVGIAQGRGRRLALTVPLAAVAAVGLVGCNSPQQHSTAAGQSAAPVVQPSPSASAPASPFASASPTPSVVPTPSASASPSSSSAAPVAVAVKLNGTAHNGLTISNGTRYVVMGGRLVDFGTAVRDLAWSPDGRMAAFIDGAGDLVVSAPDGTHKVVVAKNPGGQTWSHPTWQVTPTDKPGYFEHPGSTLFFAAAKGGTTRLEWVSATAVDGTPQQLGLNSYSDPDAPVLPQTGNAWINARGLQAQSVYENTADGKVYIRDEYLRQQGGVLTDGSEPAVSAEDEIVFVRSVGGHDHLFEFDRRTGKARDLTSHATTDYTEPAFSADGKTIAARTPAGISTLPADGSAAPVHVSDYTGLPAYRHG